MYTSEVGNMTLVQATGLTTITSGKAVLYGIASIGSATAGIQLFAGVTSSVSLTPMINFSVTASAVAGGFSPFFLRMPMTVSGSGFTVSLLGTTDPNMMIYWNPDGQI